MYVVFNRALATAHRIPNDPGKCHRIHGHTYHVEVSISTDGLDQNGMVVHFDKVKGVLDRFDHRLVLAADDPFLPAFKRALDDVWAVHQLEGWIVTIPYPPSAENLAKYFSEQICLLMQSDGGFVRSWAEVEVKVRESDAILAQGVSQWYEVDLTNAVELGQPRESVTNP